MNDKVLIMRNGKTVWGPAPKDGGPIDPSRLPEGYPYKEQSWDPIIENVVVTTTQKNEYYAMGNIPSDLAVITDEKGYKYFGRGKKAKVVVDGVEYILTVSKGGWTYIGNYGLNKDPDFMDAYNPDGIGDTGEPFCIGIGGGDASKFGTRAAGTYTVSLYYETETIHPMAPEFLPALTSPNGTKYQLTVADDGTLSAVAVE